MPLVQSDSPKTAACEGLAVTVAVIKSVGFLLTEVRVSATHLVAICLPLDKRLPKLFAREKRKKKQKKTCGPEVLTSQSAIVSCVVEQLC